MGLRSTFRPRIGPFALNFDKRFQLASVTMRMFGVTYRIWSATKKRGVSSVDLPGPISYRPRTQRR